MKTHTSGTEKSNRAKREARARLQKPVLIAVSIVLIMVLCAFALILFSLIADSGKNPADKENPSHNIQDQNPLNRPSETESRNDNPPGGQDTPAGSYDSKVYEASAQKQGTLILINATHTYDAELAEKNTTMLAIFGNRSKTSTGGNAYKVSYDTLYLKKTALDALNSMMADFANTSGNTNVIVTGSYRTAAEQQSYSTPVGQSDHHSGYLVSLKAYDGKVTSNLSDNSIYNWIFQNAYKYGYVVRYPEEKSSITGINGYSYAFRYVGYPHAYYMTKNNLCLEEYVEKLKSYTFDADHLVFTGDDGNSYEIYYIPAAGDFTTVKVPSDRPYEISGTNDGGFIITVTGSSN